MNDNSRADCLTVTHLASESGVDETARGQRVPPAAKGDRFYRELSRHDPLGDRLQCGGAHVGLHGRGGNFQRCIR